MWDLQPAVTPSFFRLVGLKINRGRDLRPVTAFSSRGFALAASQIKRGDYEGQASLAIERPAVLHFWWMSTLEEIEAAVELAACKREFRYPQLWHG
jgi:hypothetical protein